MHIVIISGPIASGKSTLAKNLVAQGWHHLSTRAAIIDKFGNDKTREELQALGKKLDQEQPDWIAELAVEFQEHGCEFLVVDSVRKEYQADGIRKLLADAKITHVHLTANSRELSVRYERRHEASAYAKVMADSLERSIQDLQNTADLVIDTSKCTPQDTLVRVSAKARHKCPTPNVDVLVGGQYGSEGKGHVVAHIAPEYDALVRVGGPNAGHSVLYKGKHVSFYHLPSGVLHSPDAMLILGAGININQKVLDKEIALAESLGVGVRHRLFIDQNANVISERDIAVEAELVKGIGSTGQGVGAATAARIMERGERLTFADCHSAEYNIVDAQNVLAGLYRTGHQILLEGTQGTGLSLFHGPYPHVTSRDTTASGTMGDAGIPPGRIRKVIMVVRSNPIRVQSPVGGTSGVMSQEISWETVAERAGVDASVLREREKTTTTKRQRRVSEFDWALLARSAQLNCPTDIALTFADYISPQNTEARRYEQLTPDTRDFIDEVEAVAGAPVSMITTRLHQRSIIDRRRW